MAVFDRTWYGRVLGRAGRGLCQRRGVAARLREIRDFERSLAAEGTLIVKFWMHISPDEQLKRFESRRDDPLKSWKLTDEDWRNREKRPAYEEAVEQMLDETDTPEAPWTVIAGDSKRYARVAVIDTVNEYIEAGMLANGIEPPKPL